MCLNIGINTVAAAQTDLEIGAIGMPLGFRIEAITASCTSSAGSGGATRGTVKVQNGVVDIITGGIILLQSAASATASPELSPTLVAAQRTVAKQGRIRILVTTVAAEVVTALNVAIWGYSLGHSNLSSAND
jgi:hypothetical protein